MSAYYTCVITLAVFAMILMILFVNSSRSLTEKKRNQFIALFAMVCVCAVSEWLGVLLQGADASTKILHILVKLIELTTVPFIGLLSADIFYPINNERRFWAVFMTLHVILEVISAFTGFIFYVDDANYYYHGDYYWIYILSYASTLIFMFIQSEKLSKHYQFFQRYILRLIVVFLVMGLTMQLVNSSIKVDWICMAMTCMMFYIFYTKIIIQTDAMTNLLNRSSYDTHINILNKRTAIINFDVDDFKDVNDNYGHLLGDKCLRLIADELQKAYGSTGYCYRIGGDEYCVIADKQLDNLDQCQKNFLEGLAKVRETYEWMPNVSIGVAFYEPDKNSVVDVIKEADDQMYINKNHNKSTVQQFN